ncbi:PQ-loop repeat-containing protein [Ruminococcus sp.]|uniref:PQ-loop repeat-containing protein n=1 Tax=Ruminococcus sp. TaxID=41978 RepID=UPI0025E41476|nr:PQ-loop repeat-containing protein [Ruminococcus sp.]
MSEILETVMLVCFGCSWPMNLVKNYKCRSAKGMSLPFLLLLITGYIAGTAAKCISGSINYVLVVYLLNLVMVTLNLVVYFRNRALDRKAELCDGSQSSEVIYSKLIKHA